MEDCRQIFDSNDMDMQMRPTGFGDLELACATSRVRADSNDVSAAVTELSDAWSWDFSKCGMGGAKRYRGGLDLSSCHTQLQKSQCSLVSWTNPLINLIQFTGTTNRQEWHFHKKSSAKAGMRNRFCGTMAATRCEEPAI